MAYFAAHPETGVTRADQIAVVGDRLTTDVLMANMMGSYAVWIRDGVVERREKSLVSLSVKKENGDEANGCGSLRGWNRGLRGF